MSREILCTYTGDGISAPALLIPSIPLPNGTITKVRVVLPDGVTDGDAVFAFYIDDVDQSLSLTIPDTDDEIDDDGLSIAITEDNKGSFRIIAPFPTELPVSPINFYIYYNATGDVPYTAASSSSAAYIDFHEDTDNGTNRARLLGPASTADVSITLPAATGTVALTSDITTAVNNAVAGLSWKASVRAATTAAVTLASDLENGDTIDGVTLATGDRILVKNQASATENGIYTVNASGAPTRATDADTGAELLNASVYVQEGTANADKQFVCTTNAPITVGATNIAFAGFTAGSGDLVSTNNLSDVASAATSRTNLGVGTGDSPQFTGVNIGHASDTTLTRASAGVAAIEGNNIVTTNNLGTGVLTQLGLNANGSDSDAIGFRGIPQNSQSTAYTTVMADAGKHLLHPAADTNARTFTIDSNANVAYEVGTAITFVNETSQVVTIAITSDTLTLAGTTTTGSRSLAQNGVATAIKVTSTKWIISGSGLT